MLGRLIQRQRVSSPFVASAVPTICLASPRAASTFELQTRLAPGLISRGPGCGLTGRAARLNRCVRATVVCWRRTRPGRSCHAAARLISAPPERLDGWER